MDHGSLHKRPGKGMENEAFELNEPDNKTISPSINNNDSLGKNAKDKPAAVNIAEESATPPKVEFEDLDYDPNSANILARIINGIRFATYNLVVQNKEMAKKISIGAIFLLFNAYFITAIAYNRRNDLNWSWCDGHGMLIILTAITYWSLFYYHILKRFFGKQISRAVLKPLGNQMENIFSRWYMQGLLALIVVGAVAAFVVADSWGEPKRLVSALGVVIMVCVGFVLSVNPGRIQWRQVLGGMLLQFLMGLVVLRWETGRNILKCISGKVETFLNFSIDGADFIYGYLATGKMIITNSSDHASPDPSILPEWIGVPTLFAFQALSVIYFFSFFVGLLYHLGIMTWVVMKVGWVLQVILGTTAPESMNAAANIFLGQTEAPLLIKPFLNDMTNSEIHAVMVGGFATIAGGVMAAFIALGVNAASLLTASVMAAPAALAMSKLICPETQKSKTSAKDIETMNTTSEGNALDAAAQGATQGFVLVGNIIANLIAIISFIAFLNAIIGWIGFLVGQEQLSFNWILGKIFIPFAWCLGVDSDDTEKVALLLGLKITVNEFVAYQRLMEFKVAGSINPRSRKIAEYALCSFGNFSSVGIQLGGLGTLAPQRRADCSKVVWTALLAGTLTSLLNACVAGALIDDASLSDEA